MTPPVSLSPWRMLGSEMLISNGVALSNLQVGLIKVVTDAK
jgi:hypothetical protein